MSILSWNCRGAGSTETVRYLRKLRKMYFLDFLFLMETKQRFQYMMGVKKKLGYNNLVTVEPVGLSGGLAVLWKKSYKVNVLFRDKRVIDIKVEVGSLSFFLTCVYGDPMVARRKVVWDHLANIAVRRDEAWILTGDFNELMSNEEKLGGAVRSKASFWDFRNMASTCKIRELRSSGNRLSCAGVRDRVWVQCRLDRSFGNDEWFNLFPRAHVEYLKMWASDHRPLLISFSLENEDSSWGRFYFDKRMIGKVGFEDAVRIGWQVSDSSADIGILERIASCRKEMAKWKKSAGVNSRDNISRLSNSLEAEIALLDTDANRMKQLREIGNGRDTNVWAEKWIMDKVPKYPLYRDDSTIDLTLTVADLLLPGSSSWNEALVRRTFISTDVEIILKIGPNLQKQDSLKWGLTRNGCYSSQSGYRFLDTMRILNGLQQGLPPVEKQVWKKIWKIGAPRKIKQFLWRALSGALPVKERLRSRGIHLDTTCSVCSNTAETVCHALFTCPRAQEKARNALEYEKKQTGSETVLSMAIEAAEEWRHANIRDPSTSSEPPVSSFENRSSQSWQPPPSGVLKCNIGVSWNEAQSISGASWLLRDHNGAVLLHSRRAFSGVSSHMEADLLGFHFAVESMRSTHQRNIIFESHYTLAHDALLNPSMFPRLRLVINEVLSFLPCLQTWQMTYACEAQNRPATKIAESVVCDRRFSSYIARGGPSWLLAHLNAEAVSN
ncbi:hypothetical protein Bca4012_071441 [Brassica carinata]